MSGALVKFDSNMMLARNLLALSSVVDDLTTGALDLSDVLRASLVSGVSAFDDYVHTVVREMMLDQALGMRPPTDAYKRFQVPLGELLGTPQPLAGAWIERVVQERHSLLSFQQPDKVADAIRLISSIELWKELEVVLGRPASDLKAEQKLIVARRNQIVHEADCDPTPPHERWPISAADVIGALNHLESVVHGIDALL